MSVDYKGERFDVDGDGVPCIITASLDGNVTSLISRDDMDKRLVDVSDELDRLTDLRDQCQANLDEHTTTSNALIALRATATADPS
jgi:hypothetical protein